jgi:PP-loop superfamily ATP-utilizing enzyme
MDNSHCLEEEEVEEIMEKAEEIMEEVEEIGKLIILLDSL